MDKKNFSILLASTALAAFLGAYIAASNVLNAHFNPRPPMFMNRQMQPPMYPPPNFNRPESINKNQPQMGIQPPMPMPNGVQRGNNPMPTPVPVAPGVGQKN